MDCGLLILLYPQWEPGCRQGRKGFTEGQSSLWPPWEGFGWIQSSSESQDRAAGSRRELLRVFVCLWLLREWMWQRFIAVVWQTENRVLIFFSLPPFWSGMSFWLWLSKNLLVMLFLLLWWKFVVFLKIIEVYFFWWSECYERFDKYFS